MPAVSLTSLARPASILLGAVNDLDLPALMSIEEQGFTSRTRWSEESWRSELNNPNKLVMACFQGGEITAVACFSVFEETAELLRVIVAESSRRQGLARKLIFAGIDWAEARGADRMLLEVNQHNQSAISLYQSVDFGFIARRKDYYGTNQDALIMERRLSR